MLKTSMPCGCDPGATPAHECDRHLIDRLEKINTQLAQNLQDRDARLNNAAELARFGMTQTESIFASNQFRKIFDLTKETSRETDIRRGN
jgi:hypothetical protein